MPQLISNYFYKYIVFFVILCFNAKIAYSQCEPNLVPNPSFETTICTPTTSGNICNLEPTGSSVAPSGGMVATGWEHYSNIPKYYTFPIPGSTDNQAPFDGNSYVSVHTYGFSLAHPTLSNRSYIGAQLNTPLIAGNTYYVSMRVSSDERWQNTSSLGVKFYTNPTSNYDNDIFPIPNDADVFAAEPISAIDDWVTISGIYTATQAHTHILLGNFFDNTNTTIGALPLLAPGSNAAYFIDMVEVYDITGEAHLEPSASSTNICTGETAQLEAVVTGQSPITYSWSPATGLDDTTIANPTFSPTVDGDYTFTVTAQYPTCSISKSITIEVDDCTFSQCPENLVPNPGFEEVNSAIWTNRPLDFNAKLLYWGPIGTTTTDYWSANANSYSLLVPPRTGDAYAGIVVSNYPLLPPAEVAYGWREYAKAKLREPLVAGETYEVSFYVMLFPGSTASTDRIGAYFSQNNPTFGDPGTVSSISPPTRVYKVTPQVESQVNTFLDQGFTWVKISGDYTPTVDGEEWITIGNFRDIDDTNLQPYTTIPAYKLDNDVSYYLVDDVSVEPKKNTIPTVTINANTSMCETDAPLVLNTQLTNGTPISYTWTGDNIGMLSNPNSSNPTFTPTAPGYYIFTVEADFDGCTDTDTINIFVEDCACPFYISATGASIICNGDTTLLGVEILGGTPVSYSWSPTTGLSDPTIRNPEASPTSLTTYTVTVDFGGGCPLLTDTVNVNAVPGVGTPFSAGPDQTICSSETIMLNVTSSDPIVGPSLTWSPATYLDDPKSLTPIFTPPDPGQFTFRVEYLSSVGGGACSFRSDTVVITVNDCTGCTETVDAGPDITINTGDSTTLSATPTSGTPTYTWAAIPADASLNGQENNQSPAVSPTQNTTYTVTADFGGGCVDTDQITITVDSPPSSCTGSNLVRNPSFEDRICEPGIDANCISQGQTVGSAISGGRIAEHWNHYSWSPDYFQNNSPFDGSANVGLYGYQDSGIREYIGTELASPLAIGTSYSVTFRIKRRDESFYPNAISNMGARFYVNPTANNNAANFPVPNNAQVFEPTIITDATNWTIISGSFTADQAYTHVLLGNFFDNANTSTTQTGSAYYFIDMVEVNEITQNVQIDAGPDVTINPGENTVLNASPMGGTPTYVWTASPEDTSLAGQENLQNPMVSPTQSTTYTVTVDFGGGCVISDTISVTVNNTCPVLLDDSNIQLTNADCEIANGSITGITISGNDGSETYSWSDSNGVEIANTLALIGVGPGIYLLTVDKGACTTTTGPYTLIEEGAPLLDDSALDSIDTDCDTSNGGISGITISGNSGSEVYEWSDQNGNVVGTSLLLNGISPGSYILRVTDQGCSALTGPYVIEEVDNCQEPEPAAIRIATAMTPNGDGSNDMFMIAGLENYPNNRLYVFNRWGNKVYEASNYQNDWFGNYQNKPLPVATYYYILELNDSTQFFFKGTITIIR